MPTPKRSRHVVNVYAIISHENKLLVVGDSRLGGYTLPGGVVHDLVEHALRRAVQAQLGTTVAAADFCSVIEYATTDIYGERSLELAFLFDVTISDLSAVHPRLGITRWVEENSLATLDLRPEVLRRGMVTGGLSLQSPWWPQLEEP